MIWTAIYLTALTLSMAEHPDWPIRDDIPFPVSGDITGDRILEIYDMFGRKVRGIDLGYKAPGSYITKDRTAQWDGRNDLGEEVSSGVYFYAIKAGDFSALRKMILRK